MTKGKSAIIFIGFQNDYFAQDGILRSLINYPGKQHDVLTRTLALIDAVKHLPVLLVHTPIVFTPDYSELVNPAGVLKTIKEAGAFKEGTKGAETVPEFIAYGDRIVTLPGKRGLNAFSNTRLRETLREREVTDLYLAGVITSVCIDSTGRSAFDKGYRVHVLKDCTAGRSDLEQTLYCDAIFPLYAEVLDSSELITRLGAP